MTRRRWFVVGVVVIAGVGSIGAAPNTDLLIDAVKSGNEAAVRTLLQNAADVNAPSADGTTPLHWAVHRNDLDLVDVLIHAGANVKATNRYGVAPVSLAAENGNAAIIAQLLAGGADPNTTLPGSETVLMTAARTGDVKVIDALIAHGADVSPTNPRGQTPLMWAAAKNNAAAIRLLVERGADINARTAADATDPTVRHHPSFEVPPPTGFSAFLFAVRAGNLDAVRALLEKGANLNDTLSDGQNSLVVALANAHWGIADFLLDHGADPSLAGAGWNALHQAIRIRRPNPMGGKPGPIPTGSVDSIEVVKKMIARGVDVNTRMTKNGMKDGQRNRLIRTGATAFLLAAKSADVEAMKVLLEAGADPTIPTVENVTPLMVAAGLYIYHVGEDGGSLTSDADVVVEAVKMCSEHGNDVNAVDAYGYTPLHGAAYRGLNSVVEHLVLQGAILDARTNLYDLNRQTFLAPGEKSDHLDKLGTRGWTPLAIANGLSYGDFYTDQPHTAELLRKLMRERGLPTEGEAIDPKVCADCRRSVFEREQEVDSLAAFVLGQQ